MLGTRIRFFSSRLLGLIGLSLFVMMSSGCATRALMSSDRYEKPEPETQQFRSSDEISKSWQPGSSLEQRYLAAIENQAQLNIEI